MSKLKGDVKKRILTQLGNGTSLNSICKKEWAPCYSTVFNYINKDEEFRALYEEAKKIGLEKKADEICDIADEDVFGDSVAVQRNRLRMDARKWTLSKLLPKKYGDKIDLNHGGQGDNPMITKIERVIVDKVVEKLDDENTSDKDP